MRRLFFCLLLGLASATVFARDSIIVDSMKVKLFYQYSARFSPPITSEDFLNNVFVGEYFLQGGQETEPADTALIDVAVSLPSGHDAFGTVELLITDLNTKLLISRMQHDIGKFSATGVSHVPFLLSPIGCAGVQIQARVKTAGISGYSKPKSIALPFVCSE